MVLYNMLCEGGCGAASIRLSVSGAPLDRTPFGDLLGEIKREEIKEEGVYIEAIGSVLVLQEAFGGHDVGRAVLQEVLVKVRVR